jgi:diguanylate cyclase
MSGLPNIGGPGWQALGVRRMLGAWSSGKHSKQSDWNVPSSSSVPRGSIQGGSDRQGEQALESLARILRTLGRHAFDLDQRSPADIEKEFERWAMHVLVGSEVREGQTESPDLALRRDWVELTRFVDGHRREEKQHVEKQLQDVRDVLWEFTRTMGRSVVEDQETDHQVETCLTRLREVSEKGTLPELKRAVLSAVQGITALVEERQRRHAQHIQALGEKLHTVERELGAARQQMMEDPLTRVFNRGALDLQLKHLVDLSVFSIGPAVLFMVDIDCFKRINDTYGHPAGDGILQQLADRLISTFPRKTDFIARYGGEEFSVILSETNLETAQRLGDRLLRVVEGKPFSHQDLTIPVTVSIGGAELIPGESSASWLERADRALYQAKSAGRNRICFAQATGRRESTSLESKPND